MPIHDLMITIAAVFLGSIGQLMMKVGLNSFTAHNGAISISSVWGKIPAIVATPAIILSILSFIVSAGFWMVMMSKRDLSQMYSFIALANFFIAGMAYLILKEQIGPWRLAGIIIIVIGVVVLSRDNVVSVNY
jgi:drug/metabolite transporter (DMT)-like permease